MPKFYFHVRDDTGFTRDSEGQELPNEDAARQEAVSAAREILGEKLLHGGSLNHRSIEVADEAGRIVGEVSSRDVLFQGEEFRVYTDDVTQSAPTNLPPE
ncbi:MAG: hypothetical protein ABI608_11815 [Rhizomicrobium sp.]